MGIRLTRALVAAPGVRRVVAVDTTRGDVEGATWRIADITSPELASRIAKVEVVVHCGVDLGVAADPDARSRVNVRSAQAVLTAAAAAGVRRVVLVTSAMVYGAVADNPVPLSEDAPVEAVPDGALVADLLEIERLAQRARTAHPSLEVTVVRPAALVGGGTDSVFTRHFEAPRLLVVRGTHPRWQFCHIDDLVSALLVTATQPVGPILTVGCDGWLEQDEVETLAGLRRIELPAAVAVGTAERLHRLGLSPAPASELQYVMHPWVIPSTRLREAGWRPVHDNTTALGALLEQIGGHHAVAARRLGRKDATFGAAGAAVAVVGTAALVRAARKRRHG
jgi:nucleoside-diphosphate-sugar epimerase